MYVYLSCPNPSHNGQNDINKGLSDSHLFREKFISDNPTTRPRINHPRSPDQLPDRCPERPGDARHILARPQLPLSLQDGGEADHDEKPARVDEFRAAPEAPKTPDVHDGGDEISTHNRAVPSGDFSPRARAVHHE